MIAQNSTWTGENSPDYEEHNPFWKDPSFDDFLTRTQELSEIKKYFPEGLKIPIFEKQKEIERIVPSSYKEHGYGYLFYGLVRTLKPLYTVELGVYKGFSLLTMAAALRDNNQGQIFGFDLFEDYQYRHDTFNNVSDRINDFGFNDTITLKRADFKNVYREIKKEVDVLHVDVSNTGDTFHTIFDQWSSKVKKLMIFEGGSHERDNVSWMVKYGKPSITKAIDSIKSNYLEWDIIVLNPYPSVTLAMKKE